MSFITTALLATLAITASASPMKRWPNPLGKDAVKDGKVYFGTAFETSDAADPKYTAILDEEFNQYTPENEMKWEVIEPSRGVFNWTGSDLIFQKAKETGSIVRGHNFVWDQQTPTYVTNITDPTELKAVLKEHIDAVMGRYGDMLYAFDVINEPLNENGTIKSSVWYNVLGEDYLGIALDLAHAAAPNVKLYINDYNIEGVNNKSLALVDIAKNLLDNGHALHGIGFESHFIGGEVPTTLAASMKQFTDLGLDVAITELDVRVPVANNGVANSTWLTIQASDYSNVVQTCLDNPNCPGITVWEFGDLVSWIPGVFAGYGAACLYDLEYNEKPAFTAVQNVLVAAEKN